MMITVLIAALLAGLSLLATAATYAATGGRRGEAGTAPLTVAGALLAFAREWLAGLALLAARPLPARPPRVGDARRRFALLVPELHCGSGGFWYLCRRLRAHGWEPIAGLRRGASAAITFAALDARIRQLPAGSELVLVGHGCGGVLAHRYAQARPALRIGHVVTLAAPHGGSAALAYRILGGAVEAVAAALPASEAACVDVIAIYSDFDAWLVPVDDAYCPGGFNIAVRGVGHCAILLSRRVADLIVENLAAPAPASSSIDHRNSEAPGG